MAEPIRFDMPKSIELTEDALLVDGVEFPWILFAENGASVVSDDPRCPGWGSLNVSIFFDPDECSVEGFPTNS